MLLVHVPVQGMGCVSGVGGAWLCLVHVIVHVRVCV
jgi:hypothetical protein